MISLEAARALVAEKVRPLSPVHAPLASVFGRILRQEVRASEDFPAFDRSAMDGYAVAADDPSAEFRIVAEIPPGVATEVVLQQGECARIFTGAAIPRGASQVIMQENVERRENSMRVLHRDAEAHIRARGEDARTGDLLLNEGMRLGPAEASLLAQLGMVRPRISPAPRVIHFTTGNELVGPEQTPAPGQIRDSNSTLVAGLLARHGATLLRQERCVDSLEALAAAVEATPDWDMALISGGASVGDYDFGARALERLGFTLHFRKINLRPGKPLVFATRGTQSAFVIPGNPVSHLITFCLVIAHALACLEGCSAEGALCRVRLSQAALLDGETRELWWPARVKVEDGALSARPLAWRSSGDLCGIATANGLLRFPAGGKVHAAGDAVECLLLDHRF